MNQSQKVLIALYTGWKTTNEIAKDGVSPRVLWKLKNVWLIKSNLIKSKYCYNVRENTLAWFILAERDIKKLSRFKRLLLKIRRFAV